MKVCPSGEPSQPIRAQLPPPVGRLFFAGCKRPLRASQLKCGSGLNKWHSLTVSNVKTKSAFTGGNVTFLGKAMLSALVLCK